MKAHVPRRNSPALMLQFQAGFGDEGEPFNCGLWIADCGFDKAPEPEHHVPQPSEPFQTWM
jgi:hypothetical protein